MNRRTLDRFSFGDSLALADELADLVLAGRKHATCWAVSDGPITSVGKHMVMLDGAGIPSSNRVQEPHLRRGKGEKSRT
jgi:uncharacterized protein YhfF